MHAAADSAGSAAPASKQERRATVVRVFAYARSGSRPSLTSCSATDSGIRRQAYCTFGCDSYAPTAPERTVIFIAILPPPAGPSSTPLVPDQPCAPLDIDALSVKLSDSG